MKNKYEKPFGIVKLSASGDYDIIPLDSIEIPLELLQGIVEGHIEVVKPRLLQYSKYGPLLMVINEDGKIIGLSENSLATALYGNPYDAIVGNVCFGSIENPDPNAEPDIYALPMSECLDLVAFFDGLKFPRRL